MVESNFIHPMEDVEGHTGLPRKFIERCNAELSDILEAYRVKGDKNRIYYNSNGLKVFDRIKQLKAQGFTLPRMAKALENELGNSESDQESRSETSRNDLENKERGKGRGRQDDSAPPSLIRVLQESTERVIEAKDQASRLVTAAKDEVIQSKEETIQQLKNNLLLLTDGRSVEEVQAELKKARGREATLEKLRDDEQRRRQRKAKRTELLAELEQLEGRWRKRKHRKKILTQLRELDEND